MTSNRSRINKINSPTSVVVLLAIAVLSCLAFALLSDLFQDRLAGVSNSNKMIQFNLVEYKMHFLYPENWWASLTPQGNHGDVEVIAFLGARGAEYQNLTVASKHIKSEDISEIGDWGDLRIEDRFARYESQPLVSYSSDEISGLIREYKAYTNSPLEIENAHCKDLYFAHEQNAFSFSFCVDENDWRAMSPVFDRIIDSIEFSK